MGGVNYRNLTQDAYAGAESDASLASWAATGANWVGIVALHDTSGTDVIAGDLAPSVADLTHAIGVAHGLGLSVMLKVNMVSAGTLGAAFSDANWAAWFTSYGTLLATYADLCEAEGVELLCIGNELQHAADQETRWRALIAAIRALYTGNLTYSALYSTAVWLGEELQINWWDALDYIGVGGYYPLTALNDPTLAQLEAGWTRYVGLLQTLAARFQRPVILTEVGYRSASGTNTDPADYAAVRALDQQEQADCYQAMFNVLLPQGWLQGVFPWEWQAIQDEYAAGDTSHVFRGKLAEVEIATVYGAL